MTGSGAQQSPTTSSGQAATGRGASAPSGGAGASPATQQLKASLRGQDLATQMKALAPPAQGAPRPGGAAALGRPGAAPAPTPSAADPAANAAPVVGGAAPGASEPGLVVVDPRLAQTVGGADTTITHDPDGPCQNASGEGNAMWSMTPNIALGSAHQADGWHLRIDHIRFPFHWRLNPTTVWNTIDQFPGGAYTPSFNTREGSEVHELAEIHAAEAIYQSRVEAPYHAFTAQAFPTEQALQAAHSALMNPIVPQVHAQIHAISTHANPVGPNAEWAYYQAHAGGHGGHHGGHHGGGGAP